MPFVPMSVERRLEEYTSRLPDHPGCWIWIHRRDHNGYGQILIKRRPVLAHRESYRRHVGPIPEGMSVLHRCDIPSCIRPDHLFLGTQSDNVTDAWRKGRMKGSHLEGEHHPLHKLTNEKVLAIRSRRESGESRASLAREFGVTPQAIGHITRRLVWRHL